MKFEGEDVSIYEQHDDPDVVIPDKIAFPLLISSNLLLITAIVSIVYKDYGIFAVVFFLYVTSINHWYKPRFSRWARIADYLAVLTALVYGSVFAVNLGGDYTIAWFIGLLGIGIIFITNETLFYLQIQKSVTGTELSFDAGLPETNSIENGCERMCMANPTRPNTAAREYVYKRTVWVHLICVHVFANALALGIVISSSKNK